MISKKNFVSLMEAIVKENDFQSAINDVFMKYNSDSTIMNCGLEGAVIRYLQDEFGDLEDDWIGYFCYERDYLRKFEVGDIVFKDGATPDIKNWEDVYDFLIDRINERK